MVIPYILKVLQDTYFSESSFVMSCNEEGNKGGIFVHADWESSAADPTSLGSPSVIIPSSSGGICSPNIGASNSTVTTLSALADSNSFPASSVTTEASIKFKIMRESSTTSKSTKSSPVWTYFQHFDLTFHPEMKHFRVCLVCRANGVDKAISVGSSASPGPLVAHLRTHNAEYLEYMEKKVQKAQVSVSNASKSQASILSFTPQVTFFFEASIQEKI
jgi:hypothetical protein